MQTKLIPLLAAAALITSCGGSSKSATTAPGTQSAGSAPASAGAAALQQDAEAKANARNTLTALETCYTDSQTYKTCDVAKTLGGPAPPSGSGPGQVEVKATDQSYTIIAHSQSGDTFTAAKNAQGALQRTCTASDPAGSCHGGTW